MTSLLPVLEYIVLEKLLAGGDSSPASKKLTGVFIALFSFLTCLGFGFLIYAAYLGLLPVYSPAKAAAFAGALSLWIVAIMCGLAWMIQRYKRHHLRQIRHDVTDALKAMLDTLDDELGTPVRENPKTSVLLASLAGFIAGEKIL